MDTSTLKIRKAITENLNQFAEGDVAFRNELRELMIKDLQELQESVKMPGEGGAQAFNSTVHKVKATLEILGQGDFLKLIDDIKAIFAPGRHPVLTAKLREFYIRCGRLITAMQEDSFA